MIERGAIVAVIAIPIALIVATWQPLEPLPRAGRDNAAVQDGADGEATAQAGAPEGRSKKEGRATPVVKVGTPPSRP